MLKRLVLFFVGLVLGCTAVALGLITAHTPPLWTAVILLSVSITAVVLFTRRYLRNVQFTGSSTRQRLALICCPLAALLFIGPLVQAIRNRQDIPVGAAVFAAAFYVFMLFVLGFTFVRVLKRLLSPHV